MTLVTYPTEEALKRELIFVLYQHKGHANAIDRWSLVRRMFGDEAVPSASEETDSNPCDRRVRETIEELRNPPHLHFICNLGEGSGYFIAKDRAEFEKWKQYYLGASYKKFITMRALDPKADETWGRVPKQPDPLPLFDYDIEKIGG